MTVRDAVLAYLRGRGATTVFGNPGSTELPLLAGLPSDFTYVLGLQEAVVVAMADGFAKGTGEPAVVSLHAAAGVGNAIGALVNAHHNRTPMLVLAGQQDRRHLAGEPYLSGRLVDLVRPYTKWAVEPTSAADVPAAIARAFDLAALPPEGPAFVSVPMDDWTAAAHPVEERRLVAPGAPPAAELDEAAALLDGARRPALVAGAGIDRRGAWQEMVSLAELLGADVYAEPLAARSSFPRRHPRFAGDLPVTQAGLAETLRAHDVVLVVGAPAFTLYRYEAGGSARATTRVVQLTDDPAEAARADAQLVLMGDVRLALHALGASLSHRAPAADAAAAAPRRSAPPATGSDEQAPTSDLVLHELVERLPHDAIVAEELPSMQAEVYRRLPMAAPGTHHASASGGLGFALPAAVGLAMSCPQRRVACVTGDGSAAYALPALWSAARARVPVPFVILDNGGYGILEAFARRVGLEDLPAFDLGGIDFVAIARGFGCAGERVDTVAELRPALERALAAAGPYVLHVRVGEPPSGILD